MSDLSNKLMRTLERCSQIFRGGKSSGSAKKKDKEEGASSAKSKVHSVPRVCTLDGFAEELEQKGGMDPTQLEPLTEIAVKTEDTLFAVTVLNPSESQILIQGGKLFSQPFKGKLCGASFGGSFLKMRWIGIGMRMEIRCDDCTVLTPPVRSIEVKDEPAILGPF